MASRVPAAADIGVVESPDSRSAKYLVRGVQDAESAFSRNLEAKLMTYVMTKPCPVCRQQLIKQRPTETVQCTCGKHVWQG
jgi:hypothetical protein